jgi:hypothetical protein
MKKSVRISADPVLLIQTQKSFYSVPEVKVDHQRKKWVVTVVYVTSGINMG